MKLYDYLDRDLLETRLEQGYVRKQVHPVLPGVSILNYGHKAQIEGVWDDVTRRCRGLVYNDIVTGEVLARPFEKFFNNNQPEAPAWALWDYEDMRVQDKMDGSLGIIYPSPDQPTGFAVATRGSFTSDQALWATRFLNERYPEYRGVARATTLVEIIYPENRIVVDYKGRQDLVLLDVLDTETGSSLLEQLKHFHPQACPFPVTPRYTWKDITRERANAEGYVVTNVKTGERVKIKFETYLALHRLLTGVSAKTVWELLSKGEDPDTILDTVPDEVYEWARAEAKALQARYDRIFQVCWGAYLKARQFYGNDRKGFALYVADSQYKDVLFGLYDDKDVSSAIWKRLKPEHAKPFWNQNEDVG